MNHYNATATFKGRIAGERADEIMDALASYHPAVGAGPAGLPEVVITLPAESLDQALQTARAVLSEVVDLVGLEVLPTDLWDRRSEVDVLPALASVTEAASRFGITRQAVLQRLESGSLHGRKVGNSWVMPESQLPRMEDAE